MGGLGSIIISNLKLSWVKLMLGWVVTIDVYFIKNILSIKSELHRKL